MCLVFAFVAFVAIVGSVTTCGSVTGSFATSRSVAGSGVGSRLGILSKFFIGNNLLLKLLRTFSLVLSTDNKLFKKDFFSNVLVPFSKFFN